MQLRKWAEECCGRQTALPGPWSTISAARNAQGVNSRWSCLIRVAWETGFRLGDLVASGVRFSPFGYIRKSSSNVYQHHACVGLATLAFLVVLFWIAD